MSDVYNQVGYLDEKIRGYLRSAKRSVVVLSVESRCWCSLALYETWDVGGSVWQMTKSTRGPVFTYRGDLVFQFDLTFERVSYDPVYGFDPGI